MMALISLGKLNCRLNAKISLLIAYCGYWAILWSIILFLLQEKFFLMTTAGVLKAAPEKLADVRAATLKLMIGTQMDYYREHPEHLGIFPDLQVEGGKDVVMQKMQKIHDQLGLSFAPIDKYFDDAFARLKTWANTYTPSKPSKPPGL